MQELSAFYRFVRLPARAQLTTLRVVLLVVFVEIGVRWIPLLPLARGLGIRLSSSGDVGQSPIVFTDRELRQIDATRRVLRRWPIAPSPCLREALVLGHLLRRRQPRLCIGVTRRGKAIVAHAWLEIQGSEIGKDEQFRAFVFSRS